MVAAKPNDGSTFSAGTDFYLRVSDNRKRCIEKTTTTAFLPLLFIQRFIDENEIHNKLFFIMEEGTGE